MTNYEQHKQKLLSDTTICKENRDLFKQFFEYEEYKLKRKNNLAQLDEGCKKTLHGYIGRLRNVNKWFNKPLKNISKADIKRVYDDLEDGKITNKKGQPYKDRQSFYNKIFKSKLFRMINKAELSREVMEFSKPNKDREVRFITLETFKKMVNVAIKPQHKLLLWLSWDVGENINSLLRLRKKDCTRQVNEQKEPEYRINLRREILKRSRTPRSEITNYNETVEFLDLVLDSLKEDELLFPFEYRMSKKMLDRVVTITKAKCIPNSQPVTWKDLRSSMACDLLSKGWSTDEVNARLGHKPSSVEIDKYVNFLALDRQQPKKKIFDHDLNKVKAELEETKSRERLLLTRLSRVEDELKSFVGSVKPELLKLSVSELRSLRKKS